MNALVRYHLRKFCDKHGIDYQEIDDTLTYWENKEHLKSFILPNVEDQLKEWGPYLREMRSEEVRYKREHTLSAFIIAELRGETVSEDMGDPQPSQRSPLAAFIRRRGSR